MLPVMSVLLQQLKDTIITCLGSSDYLTTWNMMHVCSNSQSYLELTYTFPFWQHLLQNDVLRGKASIIKSYHVGRCS
jgi:hypothetical protein